MLSKPLQKGIHNTFAKRQPEKSTFAKRHLASLPPLQKVCPGYMSTGHTGLLAVGPPVMPGGKGDWQLASVPAGQHSGMWQKVKVTGNGRMRRRNGTGVEVMGGIGRMAHTATMVELERRERGGPATFEAATNPTQAHQGRQGFCQQHRPCRLCEKPKPRQQWQYWACCQKGQSRPQSYLFPSSASWHKDCGGREKEKREKRKEIKKRKPLQKGD